MASPLGAAGQRPEESRAGSFVKQSAASARRTHPVWRKRQPGLPVGAADVPSSRFVQIPGSALAPIRHLSHLTAGSPRVMPAHTQPSPACPRSSAPRGPRRGITIQSAFPTRSQKSSGALPARFAGVARGHPVRGNGSWERSGPFPLFAKRLQNHCRGYLPGVGIISADFISGRTTGFSKGCPL